MTILNKKCGIVTTIVVVVVCIILGVLLGVLLPRRDSQSTDDEELLELPESSPWYGNEEIKIFRQYLRIPTVNDPDIDYEPCVAFLKKQAESIDLPVSVYYPANEKNPVVVMTWLGSEPDLPTIMLNSHTDVVPVFEEFWTHPPFAADVDEQGRIYARGSQDTKGVGMMYLAAIRALKQRDGIKQLKRTVHIIFVPDEEMGGLLGMDRFVLTDEFRALNVGYVLDEGTVSASNRVVVTNDERCTWRIEFIAHGVTGHGSILFENTTGEKVAHLISLLMERRKIEMEKLIDSNNDYTNVTTINLTVIKGGVQGNVIPPELSIVFDVRLGADADHDAFEKDINRWCEESGGNITINYLIKDPKAPATPADETNPMWVVLEKVTKESGIEIAPIVARGASDMKYLRRLNILSLGFTPIINTTPLAHDHDEHVHADVYLAGIEVYRKIIPNLADI
ncbi:aminoacylase-1-like [Bradysia coprophila]|uniref:aminoacylase-1-like n=1 Tax=Bradysia coprophila TaxID=38358 RepID=UPI00187D7309|nr:aminoacylase-1-like [Bradysia coprophila]